MIQDADLKDMFAAYGSVKSVEIIKDIISGESRGFGFVEMEDDHAAKKAIAGLNQIELDTLPVTVQENTN
jgi:RNA recognition motif-containing protein